MGSHKRPIALAGGGQSNAESLVDGAEDTNEEDIDMEDGEIDLKQDREVRGGSCVKQVLEVMQGPLRSGSAPYEYEQECSVHCTTPYIVHIAYGVRSSTTFYFVGSCHLPCGYNVPCDLSSSSHGLATSCQPRHLGRLTGQTRHDGMVLLLFFLVLHPCNNFQDGLPIF